MAKKTITIMEPDFYKDFHCVADACRASCCVHPWVISMEKSNYKMLRNLKEPKWLAENFTKFVKKFPDKTTDELYAYFEQTERGCPLLTEDGLCLLVCTMGPGVLCKTCRVYPRCNTLYRRLGEGITAVGRGLCTSCEEVTRILLTKKEPIRFESHTTQAPAEWDSPYYADIGGGVICIPQAPMRTHYYAVQAVAIAVLQSREYSLEKRMVLLCLLFDKLAQAEAAGQADQLPAMLDRYVAAVQAGAYDPVLDKPVELDSARQYANQSIHTAMEHAYRPEMIGRCNAGMAATGYDGWMAAYQTFVADNGHLIEHLLVTEVCNKCLPFYTGHSIAACTQYMVAIFANLRFLLGTWLAGDTKFTETELIDLVAFFGKTVLHDKGSFEKNIQLLEINQMNTLPYLIAIVKG